MKKNLIMMAFVLMGLNTFAQVQRKVAAINENDSMSVSNDKYDKDKPAKKTDKLKILKELNLTREQKGKLKEIRQANKSKTDHIMNDVTLTADQKKDKVKEIKKSGVIELQGILNDEQKAKMKEMIRENKDNSNR